jgi:hypothetical protein
LAKRRHRFTTVTLLTKNPAVLMDQRYVDVLHTLGSFRPTIHAPIGSRKMGGSWRLPREVSERLVSRLFLDICGAALQFVGNDTNKTLLFGRLPGGLFRQNRG